MKSLTLSSGTLNFSCPRSISADPRFRSRSPGRRFGRAAAIEGGGLFAANGGLTWGGRAPNTSYAMTLETGVTLVNAGVAVMQQGHRR